MPATSKDRASGERGDAQPRHGGGCVVCQDAVGGLGGVTRRPIKRSSSATPASSL